MRQENCISSRGFEYGVKHLLSPSRGPISEVISQVLLLPESNTIDLINLGAVYHHKIRLQENTLAEAGDYIRIHTKPRRFPPNHYNWNERTVLETPDFVILNKPGGLPCHPTVDNKIENLLNYAQKHFGFPLFITHRLDVPTSGLILLSKTTDYTATFNQYLQDRRVKKIYKSKVSGHPQLGRHVHFMQPSFRAPKIISSINESGSLICELELTDLNYNKKEDWSECEINLLTGRTHQIRAQMAHMGFPIFGDSLYGSTQPWKTEQIALCCTELLIPSINNNLNIHIELPGREDLFSPLKASCEL